MRLRRPLHRGDDRPLVRWCRAAVIVTLVWLQASVAVAADQEKPAAAAAKTGINKDALTMQECRDRLAVPKRERPPSDDPGIDKDAVCINMLGNDRATHKRHIKHAKAASAA